MSIGAHLLAVSSLLMYLISYAVPEGLNPFQKSRITLVPWSGASESYGVAVDFRGADGHSNKNPPNFHS